MDIQNKANQRFYSALIRERQRLAAEIFKLDTFKAAEMIDKLTRRERQVMEMLCYGVSMEGIAKRLEIGHSAVKWYRDQVTKKLHIETKEFGRFWFAYKFQEVVRMGAERSRHGSGRKRDEMADHTILMSWQEVSDFARGYALRHWHHTKRAVKFEFVDLQGSLVEVLDSWFKRSYKEYGHVTTFDVAYQIEVWIIVQRSHGKDDCPMLAPKFDVCAGKATGNVSS